ncbi:DUF29 domain-containing protein [Endozoicomonas sp. 4G]|uniref:DUF29 domain-containing protein n=1 Tax=Endozoicomonas sp. 4G TaxID=2872754 RepID=UPI0020788003|nr:DUF29 domain-containing protein [Endozoicomonas sp. 4G]
MNSLYETDYHQWLGQQREHLIKGQLDQLDVENLIEELELGIKQDFNTLKSHLMILIIHLLKWDYQEKVLQDPWVDDCVKPTWLPSINNPRDKIELHLEENPNVVKRTDEAMAMIYPQAKQKAIDEMNKYARHENQKLNQDSFPVSCPWSFEQLMDKSWPVLKPVKRRK